MTTKHKAASRILEAVHETAGGLHQAGFIDKRRMREYRRPVPCPGARVFEQENSRLAGALQIEPSRAGIGAEHKFVDDPSMGDRGKTSKRPVTQVA